MHACSVCARQTQLSHHTEEVTEPYRCSWTLSRVGGTDGECSTNTSATRTVPAPLLRSSAGTQTCSPTATVTGWQVASEAQPGWLPQA